MTLLAEDPIRFTRAVLGALNFRSTPRNGPGLFGALSMEAHGDDRDIGNCPLRQRGAAAKPIDR
jgi:hypothetical protein